MSENDHAAAIRELLTGVDWDRMSGARKMHAAIGHADALAAELEAERARAARLRALLFAVNDLATALVDMLTDDQVDSPDYPNDLDERHGAFAKISRLHGDLDPTEAQEGADDAAHV